MATRKLSVVDNDTVLVFSEDTAKQLVAAQAFRVVVDRKTTTLVLVPLGQTKNITVEHAQEILKG